MPVARKARPHDSNGEDRTETESGRSNGSADELFCKTRQNRVCGVIAAHAVDSAARWG